MKPLHALVALGILAAAAGCAGPEESASEERTRGLVTLMPDNSTKLVVDITATAPGNADVTVAVDANGTVLGDARWQAIGESRDHTLEVDTKGAELVGVQITARGDVVLHVVLSAVMPDGSRETLRDEWMTIADA